MSKAKAGRGSRVAEMRTEYDFSNGERCRYAKVFGKGTTVVALDPDLADVFPTAADVNRALRAILDAVPKRTRGRRSSKETT
ncbi:MAG TPA: hypothetical protein VGM77_05935 [Gemmatimonadales bacterium]